MRQRIKHVCVVILAQAACLSVGLWMQHRFVRSAAVDAALEAALSDLHATARQSVSLLGSLDASGLEPGTPAFDDAARRLAAIQPSTGRIALLDGRWRVAVTPPEPPGDPGRGEARLARGATIAWQPRADRGLDPDAGGSRARGFITVGQAAHAAVVHPVADKTGYVLIHRPRADIERAVAVTLGSMPAIGVLTLLWTCALLGVAAYMVLARFYDDVERERKQAATEASRQKQKLIRTRDAIIFGLAKLADSRDPETGDHLERITVYSTTLAAALRRHPGFKSQVTPAFVQLIGISSALHDIGKVGVEDSVLRKPGTLTPEERTRMHSHTVIGSACLREIELRLGSSNFLQMAREIALAHHEHWDGSGYPNGLAGEEIPLSARIVAIADVYDALSSRRVYKGPHAHEECVAVIREEAGRKFDPELVEVWLTVADRFAEIARQYADEGDAKPAEPSAVGAKSVNHGLPPRKTLVAAGTEED